MAQNKKSFLLYADIINVLEKMPDDKAGLLFKHILRYVNDQDPILDDLVVELVFEPIKQSLKRDLEKYERIVERNRSNGTKGGRPTEIKDNVVKPKETQSVILGVKNNPKKADSDSDIDNDIDNNKINLSVNWDLFLSKFNSITGKKAKVVNEKCKRQLRARLSEGYTKQDIIQAIINCSKDKYHIETGYKYLTLEFITRADKMEMFTTLKSQQQEIVNNQTGKL
jgi:uncharacterized phage protein (TIGR02220 family)